MSKTRTQQRRSDVAAFVPPASLLKVGELFINMSDNKLFYKDHTNAVRELGSSAVAVAYDNSVSGLSAVDVQAALDELDSDIDGILGSSVISFNGRGGAVTPILGDYPAAIVGYNNASSGLVATTVQGAIDEVEARLDTVQASNVVSFKGRTGAVIPATSDYDAIQIDYDNSSSGLTATELQGAIDELAAGGIGGASVSIGDSPPISPSPGNLWWQSDTGRLKIYYQDATSSQWVDVFPLADSIYEDALFLSTVTTVVPVIARGVVGQSANLQEWQNSVGTMLARITSAGGVGGQGAYVDLTSSITVKSDVEPIGDAMDMVRRMNPVSYVLKFDGQRYLGFIAEELKEVVPDAVVVNEEIAPSPLGIKLSTLTAVLAKAIQQLDTRLKVVEGTA